MTALYRADVQDRPDDGRRWTSEEAALAYRKIHEGSGTRVCVWRCDDEVEDVPQRRENGPWASVRIKVAPSYTDGISGAQNGAQEVDE